MPPIETIARPVRNRISVEIPKQYRAYAFRVVLVPIVPEDNRGMARVDDGIDPRVRSLRGLIKMSPGVIVAEIERLGQTLADIGQESDASIYAAPLVRREKEYVGLPSEVACNHSEGCDCSAP